MGAEIGAQGGSVLSCNHSEEALRLKRGLDQPELVTTGELNLGPVGGQGRDDEARAARTRALYLAEHLQRIDIEREAREAPKEIASNQAETPLSE